jgi:hypothetical protein
VLLVFEQLGIFLGLGPATSLASSAALATAAFPLPSFLLVLTINLVHNLADLGIGVRLDEVAKQVSETQKVSETAERVIFLLQASATMH